MVVPQPASEYPWSNNLIISSEERDEANELNAELDRVLRNKTAIVQGILDEKNPRELVSPEIAQLNRHRVSSGHRTVNAIEKWRADAVIRKDEIFIKNLDSMSVISPDELRLIDGTIVKIGYPEIEVDNEEIFEQTVKDTEGNPIKAVYFKYRNSPAFEKFMEDMKQNGFRMLGKVNDRAGRIARQEIKKYLVGL